MPAIVAQMLVRNAVVAIGFVVSLATPAFGHPDTNSDAVRQVDPAAVDHIIPENAQLSDHQSEPWHTPMPHNSHPWLTVLELGTTIVGGMTWYWLDRERQVADWDYPGWQSKLLFESEIFIFDNNPFMVNYSWHTFAGGASQVLGRSNGLGLYESAALGMGASIVWEYGIESRELISLNDLLITNTTGVAVGEFFHRLGQYAHTGHRSGPGWQALRWTLGLAHGVHEVWDSSLHEEPTIWPRFRFHYGLSTADISRTEGADTQDQSRLLHSLSFEGELVALEHYMQPGVRSGFFRDANFTSLGLRLTAGDGSATNVYGDTFLAGFRSENIPEEGKGGIGLAYNVGTSIGYRYHRENFGAWDSRLGGLHVPGLATDGEVFGEHWRLRWQARAHFDLMGVEALSSRRWLDANLDEDAGVVGKSILKNDGYYYAWGMSTRAKLELELPIVTLGSSLFLGKYYSIEGYDRIRDDLAYEIRGHDDFLDIEAWVEGTFYRDFYGELRFGEHRRDGQLAEFFHDESMRNWTLSVGSAF